MIENETVNLPDPKDFVDGSPQPENDFELAVLCDLLQEHGVSQVVINYQGCGDSGAVEEVVYEPEDPALPDWAEDKLKDIAESYCPDGYENNDGGFGTLTVYPFLGLAALEHSDRYEDSEAMETPSAKLPKALQRQLQDLGISSITAHFDGYGDSGQIESIDTEPENIEIPASIRDPLENLLLDLLAGGWENNEGGYGDFAIDIASREIGADAYWRVEKDSDAQTTRWKWRTW